MYQPLSRSVGNELEAREAADTLKGEDSHDLTNLVLGAAGQGGESDLGRMSTVLVRRMADALKDGFVTRIATEAIGCIALHLGAWQATAEDVIHHSVGLVLGVKRGDGVWAGDPLADVCAADEASAYRAVQDVQRCCELGAEAPELVPIVLDSLRSQAA